MGRPIGDELGMEAAEGFRNVAIPADRPVGAESLLKFFERDFVPLNGLALLIDQGGRMIVPVDFPKRLVAVNAGLSFVPAIHNGGNQTSFGCLLNLRQTVLTAIGLFGPA